jgi:hypothetical protein
MREQLRDEGPLIVGAIGGGATAGLFTYFAPGPWGHGSAGDALQTALLLAGAMVVITFVSRRRERVPFGLDRASWREVERAVRTGTPPADKSLELAVLQAIDTRREKLEKDRSQGPLMFGVLAVICFVSGFFHVFYFVVAALFVIAAATNHLAVDRSQAHLDRLAESLETT